MTIELIGFIAAALGLLGIFLEPPFIVYVFVCSTLLGSAAALTLDSLGGTNISPSHLLLGFLAFKLFGSGNYARNSVSGFWFGRPGFWLLLTVVYSIISAYLMPRLFQGQTLVFPVRTITGSDNTAASFALVPVMANFTQSIYFVGDLFCFAVLTGYAGTHSGRRVLGNAALACTALNLGFALLDLLTYFTNTTEMLSFIRNANYSMMSDDSIAGFKRIVGSFVEASSFGSATLGYFAFTGKLWLLGVRPFLTAPLAVLSLLALIFSTSTTAYVGLAVLLAYLFLEIVVSAFFRSPRPQAFIFLIGAPIIAMLGVIAIELNDNSAAYISNLLDTVVFNKMSTASGIERAMWNYQGIQNFFDTFGFGVGNGSMRASSFIVGVLASLGVFGALIFGLFLLGLFFSNKTGGETDPLNSAFRQAAKSTCIAWFITACTSGGLIDLGLPFYAFAALTCSQLSVVEQRRDLPFSVIATTTAA
jgi:hypothetical protein